MIQIKHLRLPYDGAIPGARGRKKVIVPAGTKVYCIVYGTLMYWCCYLHEVDAMRCLKGLEDTVSGKGKPSIDWLTLVAWNFKSAFPRRVYRSKEFRGGSDE